jgi:hypothetical protein
VCNNIKRDAFVEEIIITKGRYKLKNLTPNKLQKICTGHSNIFRVLHFMVSSRQMPHP